MKIKKSPKNQQHGENKWGFIFKVALIFLVIFIFRFYIWTFQIILFIAGPIVAFALIKIRMIMSGETFKQTLLDYITFLPSSYTEKEWTYDRKIQATYIIIMINVLIHYLLLLGSKELHIEVIRSFKFLPGYDHFYNYLLSPIFSNFLHDGHGHLWGNMLFLWIFGTVVERRIGWKRFIFLYLATGVCSSLLSAVFYDMFLGESVHSIGASGAIAGIMGVFMVRLYFKRIVFPLPFLGILTNIFPIRLKIRINSMLVIGLYFVNNLVGGLRQIEGSQSRTDYWAHIFGIILGIFMALKLKLQEDAYEEKHLETGLHALKKNDFLVDGEKSLRRVIDKNPNNQTALLALAREHSRHRPTHKGYRYYQRVLLLMVKSDPQQATEIFVEYLKTYTKSLDANLQYRLAGLLYNKGAHEIGSRTLELLLKKKNLPEDIRKKAINHLAISKAKLKG